MAADLSAPDAMHVLPIFVIVSMFLSQFFTPSPGMDQSQQRMMAFMMPAIFGVMMWNIGSGRGAVLGGQQPAGCGDTNGDEPDQHGAGNARHCGEKSGQAGG